MESSSTRSSLAGNGHSSSTTMSAAASPNPSEVEESKKQQGGLNQVIGSIQKTLGILHQLHLTVSSFNVQLQLPLLHRLNSLVSELDNLQRLSDQCNIQVPLEVVNLIDEGRNPDEFTRDVLNRCIAKNQVTKGKTDAFKSLRNHLLEELEQTFPEEVEAYREIRTSSAAESKRLIKAQNLVPNGDVKIKTEY